MIAKNRRSCAGFDWAAFVLHSGRPSGTISVGHSRTGIDDTRADDLLQIPPPEQEEWREGIEGGRILEEG